MTDSLEKTPKKISAMFNDIAGKYDFINDITTLGLVRIWRKKIKKTIRPEKGDKILDIAAGTGTSSAAIFNDDVEIIAVDISEKMIEVARKNYPNITFIQADATQLPFEDNTFDITTISFGIRNINNPIKALKEMYRVTKVGGKVVICEFSMPDNRAFKKLYKLYMKVVFKKVIRLFSDNFQAYSYLNESIIRWDTKEELAEKMFRAGWREIGYKTMTFGTVTLHKGSKNKA